MGRTRRRNLSLRQIRRQFAPLAAPRPNSRFYSWLPLPVASATITKKRALSRRNQSFEAVPLREVVDLYRPCTVWRRVDAPLPLYELQSSGEPYQSIVDMRGHKILNFLSSERYEVTEFFEASNYEDLVEYGSAQVAKQSEPALGIKPTCKPIEPEESKPAKLDMDSIGIIRKH